MTPPLVFTKAFCLFMAGLPPHAGQVGESASTSQGGGGPPPGKAMEWTFPFQELCCSVMPPACPWFVVFGVLFQNEFPTLTDAVFLFSLS